VLEVLVQVPLAVLGRELRARALADADPVVLGVLNPTQLGRRRQLPVVRVADPGLRERLLQALRIRPRVLAAANAPALADVDEQPDVRVVQRLEEALERPAVDADRRERPGACAICKWSGDPTVPTRSRPVETVVPQVRSSP